MQLLRKKAKRPNGGLPLTTEVTPNNSALPVPRKKFSTGLKTLYQPCDPVVDVVFIHGLTGDRDKTWTARGAAYPWPQILLPERLPEARILTFGYDAYVTNVRALVSRNRIGNHARNLLAALAAYRETDGSDNRPIIFVCHSLGGLVCEDALLSSRNSADDHFQNILECTRGIAFFGTPHHGSGFAGWLGLLAKLVGVIKDTNSEIVRVLNDDSEVLARIQTDFHTMIRSRTNSGGPAISITCFYEEMPLPGIGKVVSMDSAILPAYIAIGIHDDHMGMARFESAENPGFISVAGELRRFVKGLKPDAKPAVINTKYTTSAPASETFPSAEETKAKQTNPVVVPAPATAIPYRENITQVSGAPHIDVNTTTKHIGNNIKSNAVYGGMQTFHGPVRFG